MTSDTELPQKTGVESPHSFKLRKPLVLIAATLLIAVVVGTGGHFLNSRNNHPPLPSQPSSLPQPSTITALISTKDWKIYQNEKFGFEVAYPSNWKPIKDEAYIHKYHLVSDLNIAFTPIEREPNPPWVELYISSEVEKFRNLRKRFLYKENLSYQNIKQPGTLTIDKIPAKEIDTYILLERKGMKYKNTFIIKDGRAYLFTMPVSLPEEPADAASNQKDYDRFYTIVSSFKFIGSRR